MSDEGVSVRCRVRGLDVVPWCIIVGRREGGARRTVRRCTSVRRIQSNSFTHMLDFLSAKRTHNTNSFTHKAANGHVDEHVMFV